MTCKFSHTHNLGGSGLEENDLEIWPAIHERAVGYIFVFINHRDHMEVPSLTESLWQASRLVAWLFVCPCQQCSLLLN